MLETASLSRLKKMVTVRRITTLPIGPHIHVNRDWGFFAFLASNSETGLRKAVEKINKYY